MKIDLTKPFEIKLEKFSIGSTKDSINPYMTGKLIRKKYESEGFVVSQSNDFETSMLVWFARKNKYLDKYIKVKIGEYKKHPKTEDYIKQITGIFSDDQIKKLLFICRICSYLGDPSFADFVITKGKKIGLRYVYTGDEILRDKILFMVMAKGLVETDFNFCSLDFIDHKYQEKISFDIGKVMEGLVASLSGRVNMGRSLEDTGIDMSFFQKWSGQKSIDTTDIDKAYEKFMENVSSESKIKTLLEKLISMDPAKILGGKSRPEQLLALRTSLGINMLEANDLINLYSMVS